MAEDSRKEEFGKIKEWWMEAYKDILIDNVDGLKVGTVVRLKSGGPKMTVTNIYEGSERVECTWFCMDKESVNIMTFTSEALTWREG